MSSGSKHHESPPSVCIYETGVFTNDVGKYLTPYEYRALLLLLSENPFAGSPDKSQMVFRLNFCGKLVMYSVANDFKSLYMLCIIPKQRGEPPGDIVEKNESASQGKIDKILESLAKGGFFFAGKKIVEALFDLIDK